MEVTTPETIVQHFKLVPHVTLASVLEDLLTSSQRVCVCNLTYCLHCSACHPPSTAGGQALLLSERKARRRDPRKYKES